MKKRDRYLLYFAVSFLWFGMGTLVPAVSDNRQDTAVYKETEQEEHPKVALTFDDGPHSIYTPQLLDGLKEREAKASFFLIGKLVEKNQDIVKRMQEEGHLIGNHTYDHVRLSGMSDEKACEQVNRANEAIYEATGMYTAYLRPPFGEWKKDLDCIVTMFPVMWNIDSRDWKVQDADQVVERVVSKVQDGDIVLMHDEYATSVEAALAIVDILQKEGYEFVTVDELLLE